MTGRNRFLFFFALCTALVLVQELSAQDQTIADSLAIRYRMGALHDSDKLEILRNLAYNEMRDLDLGLKYANELVALSDQLGNHIYLYRGYIQKGNKLKDKGENDAAMEAYIKSLEAARKAVYPKGEASALQSIGNVYANVRSLEEAKPYYREAIRILKVDGDKDLLASFLSNFGDAFLQAGQYDSAMARFLESAKILELTGDSNAIATVMGNIGMVYASTGQHDRAAEQIKNAIGILDRRGNYSPISTYLQSMAGIYEQKGDIPRALDYANKSLELAENYKLKVQIAESSMILSRLAEKTGKHDEALTYFKQHVTYRDSVENVKSVKKMADLQAIMKIAEKQSVVDMLNQEAKYQRNVMIFLTTFLGLLTLLLGTLYFFYRKIATEKRRSESLLLNILPGEAAKELKENGRVNAVKFDEVTVVFSDFVSFTKVAEQVDPELLVRSIDWYFRKFDEITTRYGLEKIKTVGDAYMAACGLPTPVSDHADKVIKAAQEMLNLVRDEQFASDGLCHFEVRIGVHTGPVVAGIVGDKKWQYDIWGDTVNIASRLEGLSHPGRINISASTYQIVKDRFPCVYRGEIEVKNKGTMGMYFVE